MRKIKASSSYLKNQTRKNLAKAALCLLILFAGLSAVAFRVLSSLQVGLLEQVGLILMVAPLIGFYFYLRKYRIYSGGWQGEKQVANLLSNTLSDDYYLINDLYLKEGGGDIDHVVLAPSGIYVLETKNWSGPISCVGDQWHRAGKRNFNSSPSRQVKRNAARIKQLIDNSHHLRSLGVWVEGIVVITNKHATLQLNNPTVPVLKLPQLPNYLTNHGSQRRFSREQLEAIGKEIAKQKA
ncbi:MAG: NERD domain-containing protein [Candidatus Bathyarchaeota archaeon]|nr:NERD domain-containing protein [Candidatus Bathyarchaeota archaeon]